MYCLGRVPKEKYRAEAYVLTLRIGRGAGCFPYPHNPLTPFGSEDLSWAPFLADIATDLSYLTTTD